MSEKHKSKKPNKVNWGFLKVDESETHHKLSVGNILRFNLRKSKHKKNKKHEKHSKNNNKVTHKKLSKPMTNNNDKSKLQRQEEKESEYKISNPLKIMPEVKVFIAIGSLKFMKGVNKILNIAGEILDKKNLERKANKIINKEGFFHIAMIFQDLSTRRILTKEWINDKKQPARSQIHEGSFYKDYKEKKLDNSIYKFLFNNGSAIDSFRITPILAMSLERLRDIDKYLYSFMKKYNAIDLNCQHYIYGILYFLELLESVRDTIANKEDDETLLEKMLKRMIFRGKKILSIALTKDTYDKMDNYYKGISLAIKKSNYPSVFDCSDDFLNIITSKQRTQASISYEEKSNINSDLQTLGFHSSYDLPDEYFENEVLCQEELFNKLYSKKGNNNNNNKATSSNELQKELDILKVLKDAEIKNIYENAVDIEVLKKAFGRE